MNPTRKIALVTGVLFVVTFIAAIAGLALYGPVLDDPDYIVGAGADTRVFFGALFEVILVIANVGTAVTLFPIGGPLLFASSIAVLFGLYEQVSEWAFLASLPEIAWEASLGIYLIVKGFKPSPITSGDTGHVSVEERSPALAAAAG